MQSYAIIWVARNKDRAGISPKRFSKEDALALAEDLNASHPEFAHMAIDTDSDDVGQALITLKEKVTGHVRIIDYSEFAATQAALEAEAADAEPVLQS